MIAEPVASDKPADGRIVQKPICHLWAPFSYRSFIRGSFQLTVSPRDNLKIGCTVCVPSRDNIMGYKLKVTNKAQVHVWRRNPIIFSRHMS